MKIPKSTLVIVASYITNYSNRFAIFQIGKNIHKFCLYVHMGQMKIVWRAYVGECEIKGNLRNSKRTLEDIAEIYI